MRKEEIISKGAYTAPQFGELISVKQFIMLRRKGEKQLLLRLRNDRAEQADAMSFRIKQFDAKGNLVGTDTVAEKNMAVKGGEDFSLQSPIMLHPACIDFTVEMISADYGDYTYHLHGGKLTSSYENRSEVQPVDKEKISKQLRGKSGRVTVQTLNAPRVLVASMALVLLIIGAFAFLQLKNFMATEEFFTLDNVEYRFETDNHVDGPISITGYKGKAGNLIIPTSIEGHAVVGIGDGAFEGKALKSVTIRGDICVGQRAFADCRHMDTVTMADVTNIGVGAFAGCTALTNLTLSQNLTTLPASAFEGCSSLTRAPLREGLVSLGDNAFAGCEKLTEITIPASLTNMGRSVFAGCSSIVTLTTPYAGAEENDPNGIGYFFGGSSQIPGSLKNLVITKATDLQRSNFYGCDRVRSITLPDTVTKIAPYTFSDCVGLETVRLPANLTEIPEYTFSGCVRLNAVQLPKQITLIGAGAFQNCTSLTEMTIPDGVRILPVNVFAECSSLRHITLPSGLEAIESSAFQNCVALDSLEIPSSVTRLQTGALSGCNSLTALTVPFVGETADAPRPLSFLFGGTTTELEELTVQNARTIAERAFAGFSALTSVTLLGEIERIEARTFQRCTSLQTVLLPEGVTEIGEYAFEDCEALEAIKLPDTVTMIGEYAFEGCTSLQTLQIPSRMTVIRQGTFSGCTSLRSVTLPDSVHTVESRAFAQCSSMTDAAWLIGIEVLGNNVFESCASLTTASLPAKLTTIPLGTFSDCTALHTVTLSSQTETIGSLAFKNCTSLSSINLPSSVIHLGDGVFMGCTALTDLIIPKSVNRIGQNVIAECSSLKTLSVPFIGSNRDNADKLSYLTGDADLPGLRYVTITDAYSLANSTFAECDYLESIRLSDGLRSIGKGAFRNCQSLTEVTIPNSVTYIERGLLEGCSSLTILSVPFIGTSVQQAEPLSYFFGVYTSPSVPTTLSTVVVTNARSISAYAFDNCSEIDTILLDCDLQEIGSYAFSNCTSLKTLTIPDTVVNMDYGAFYGCSSLQELEIPFAGMQANNGSRFADLFTGESYLPHTLKKVTLTNTARLGSSAFQGCMYLTEIVLDCNVQTIGSYAFDGCTALTAFTIPDSVTNIGTGAFRNCQSLAMITIPDSVTSIGTEAFANCNSLTEVEIPDGIRTVGAEAFYNCSNLTSVTVGSTATRIDSNAFYNCYNLAELTVPFVGRNANDTSGLGYWFGGTWNTPSSLKKVTVTNSTQVQSNAFQSCPFLEEIIYTQEVTAIGHYAFSYCPQLKTLELGDSYTSIGDYSFSDCYSLRSFTIPASCLSVGNGAFSGAFSLYEVYNDSALTFNQWDGTCLRNYCLVYRTDGSGVERIFTNGFEMIHADDGFWYVIGHEGKTTTLSFPAAPRNGTQTITEYRIAANAFRDRSDLKSVTIPAAVTEIQGEAFVGCSNLAEVYDLSPLTITRGGYDNGCVAYYAYIVHTSEKAQSLTEVKVGDFTFLRSDNNWFLVGYHGSDTKLVLDTITYGGTKISSYEIGRSAFSNRYDIVSLVITDAVKSIGREAFISCPRLQSVSFASNTSITKIESYTFAYCYNLDRVILPASLTYIDWDAFWECVNLLEVYNLSRLSLTMGSTDNGCVAYYAKAIYSSVNESGLGILNVEKNGCTYKFIQEADGWNMYARVAYNGYSWEYYMPELVIQGQVTPYRATADIANCGRIIIPTSVTYVNWATFSGNEIFYEGTEAEFADLRAGFDLSYCTVRYYADCVHNPQEWSYTADGYLLESMSYFTTVIEPPTCLKKGTLRHTCHHCQKTWQEESADFGAHDLDDTLTCRVCKMHFESRTLEEMWTITNDIRYPFDITKDGEIVSTNKTDGSSATITLRATQDLVFMYQYSVSTEGGCDTLIVCLDGIEITRDSGTIDNILSGPLLEVRKGETLTITYAKDSSVAHGSDTVKVLNMVYLVEEAGDNNAEP